MIMSAYQEMVASQQAELKKATIEDLAFEVLDSADHSIGKIPQ
jgi:hypothetical protein